MRTTFSPLLSSMHIATSGMSAQSQRILIISQNLANVGTRAEAGQLPYQRKVISFKSVYNPKLDAETVKVTRISKDIRSKPIKTFAPHDPGADKDGYIYESDVKPMIELADMREASRSHEANLKAFERILSMMQSTISLLKN